MKIKLLYLSFLLMFSQVLPPELRAGDYFNQAVVAYRKADFATALTLFKKAPDSPAKFYNLGNCYYKLDSLGLSILNYQKAKKFIGEEPDLMNNLQMANAKTRDKIDPPKTFFLTLWLRKLTLFFPVWVFPLIAIVFSCLASLSFIFLVRSSEFLERRKYFFSVLTSVLVLSMSLFLSWRRQSVIVNSSGVVVLTQAASVLNEPVFGATELFVLHEGAVLNILAEEPGWVKVELPQGNSGFLRDQVVGKF